MMVLGVFDPPTALWVQMAVIFVVFAGVLLVRPKNRP